MTDLALVSGGLDSAVMTALRRPDHGVAFDYGQSHRRELDSAQRIADRYQVNLHMVRIDAVALGGSPLTGGSVDGPCVVPGRNALFLAHAVALAHSLGCDRVLIGASADDQLDYPDCRSVFFSAFETAARLGGTDVSVEAPLIRQRKADIVRAGVYISVPFESTWTCYRDGEAPCGTCASCRLRASAFAELGRKDPLVEGVRG